jgi:hypothetical protein
VVVAMDFPVEIRGSNARKVWCILLTRLEAFYTSCIFKYYVMETNISFLVCDSLVHSQMDHGRKDYDEFLQEQKIQQF